MKSLFEIIGNYTEVNYSVFDGQNEDIIGIVIPSGYSGTKFRNISVINCSVGVSACGNIEFSNIILRNEDDLFIGELATVMVSGANYIQDSSHIGPGTYIDGDFTTIWGGTDPFRRFPDNLNLDIDSGCINTGNNSIWSGETDITDVDLEEITDSEGNIVVPGGTVDIGAYEKYWKEKINGKQKSIKVIGIIRNKIGKILGRQ